MGRRCRPCLSLGVRMTGRSHPGTGSFLFACKRNPTVALRAHGPGLTQGFEDRRNESARPPVQSRRHAPRAFFSAKSKTQQTSTDTNTNTTQSYRWDTCTPSPSAMMHCPQPPHYICISVFDDQCDTPPLVAELAQCITLSLYRSRIPSTPKTSTDS